MTDATVETRIWLALKGRLATLSTDIVAQNAIAYPKASFTPPTDDGEPLPYIEVNHLPNTTERVTIANGPHRRPGILQLDLLHPMSAGLTQEQVTQLAGLIAAHFPADTAMWSADVRVRVEQAPAVAEGFEDSGYWRIPVSVRYDCFA